MYFTCNSWLKERVGSWSPEADCWTGARAAPYLVTLLIRLETCPFRSLSQKAFPSPSGYTVLIGQPQEEDSSCKNGSCPLSILALGGPQTVPQLRGNWVNLAYQASHLQKSITLILISEFLHCLTGFPLHSLRNRPNNVCFRNWASETNIVIRVKNYI